MILHTIVPAELIFQGESTNNMSKERTILYQGIPVIIEIINEHNFQIKQIISTDPNHYLQKGIYPGATVSLWD